MPDTDELYLLDTNILVHYVRNDALALWLERSHFVMSGPDEPLISVVVEGEMRSLALQFGWGKRRLDRLTELLDHALIVPLDFPGVVDAYARIDAYCRSAGTPLGENDTWIAATAAATSARLLTTDRDFQRLDPTLLSTTWVDPSQGR